MRNEYKYLISQPDSVVLKQILRGFLSPDGNTTDGESYVIRSLYFDDRQHSAYYEKEDGLEFREKFRIRIYNSSTDYIVLEKKMKKGDYSKKIQQRIDLQTAKKLIEGDIFDIKADEDSLLYEFILKMKLNGLIPDCVIEYKRTAFVFSSQTTRITIDEQLKTSISSNIFDRELPLILLPNDGEVILEVKFNKTLPPFISSVLGSVPLDRMAVSKFKFCKDLFMEE